MKDFPRPTDIEAASFARAAPGRLPASYLRFMKEQGAVQLNVPSIGSGLVCLWEVKDVLSLNAGYGFQEFAPTLFGFGSDGAGELIAFDLASPGNPRIGIVPAVALEESEFRAVASSFDEFVERLATGTDAR